jgi:hypothetical protein
LVQLIAASETPIPMSRGMRERLGAVIFRFCRTQARRKPHQEEASSIVDNTSEGQARSPIH